MALLNEEELKIKLDIPEAYTGIPTHYCPGCEHGILIHLIAYSLDKLGIREKAVMVDSVGCSVLAYRYLNIDHVQSPHGRAPAVMTGIKRTHPELIVFSVQGDGDALAIGLSELLHAAIRGEAVTVFLVNNTTYGMTGGQMAPTTLPGQVTTTTPSGRDSRITGLPVDASKLLALIGGAAYVRRLSLAVKPMDTGRGVIYSVRDIYEARQSVENAFKVQLMGGFSFVELLSSCWVNWKMPILEAKRHVSETLVQNFPLGVYRDLYGVEGK